jgi:hypothetical protein
MKRPPLLIRVQFRGEDGGFPLWLPLFLLLPVALALLIALSPLILIAIIFLRLTGRGRKLPAVARASLGTLCSVRGIRAAFDVLCSMPGLRIDARSGNDSIYVSII